MENTENINEKTDKKATKTTLIGQIAASLWVIGWSSYFNIKNIDTLQIKDIVLEGFTIVGCYSPVFFNMIMDKIKSIRFGDN